jgi:ABC-type cobalt transport system substrate-binding protein
MKKKIIGLVLLIVFVLSSLAIGAGNGTIIYGGASDRLGTNIKEYDWSYFSYVPCTFPSGKIRRMGVSLVWTQAGKEHFNIPANTYVTAYILRIDLTTNTYQYELQTNDDASMNIINEISYPYGQTWYPMTSDITAGKWLEVARGCI